MFDSVHRLAENMMIELRQTHKCKFCMGPIKVNKQILATPAPNTNTTQNKKREVFPLARSEHGRVFLSSLLLCQTEVTNKQTEVSGIKNYKCGDLQ